MTSISLRNLSKTYPNGVVAVCDANLEIDDGELLAVVGPSGCGKSTTLRLIAGLEEASRGDVLLDGRPAERLSPRDRNIAMVFQDDALYPHMTVRRNLSFGLKLRKVPRQEIERRVGEVARALAIESLLPHKPLTLSGGQRRRVALGRAIVRNPSVFLLDEPLSSLDAHQRILLRSKIRELHQRLGTTMVYVTHDQSEAMSLGHRIAVMNRGVFEQVDSPMDLYRRPGNRFVAGYIGSPPMTFIDGEVQGGLFHRQASTLPVGSDFADGPVTLGVRPEDWLLDDRLPTFGEVRAESVERLGHETLVQFTLHGEISFARLAPGDNVNPGEPLQLAVRPASWLIFSRDDKQRRLGPVR